MAITKNPIVYLWLTALGRWSMANKALASGICLGVVGLSSLWLAHRSPASVREVAHQAPLPVATPSAPECNVNRRPHHYPATRPEGKVNPGGICAVALFIKGHCVYFTQENRDEPG